MKQNKSVNGIWKQRIIFRTENYDHTMVLVPEIHTRFKLRFSAQLKSAHTASGKSFCKLRKILTIHDLVGEGTLCQ